jgi:hypothetical protein
MQSQVLASPWHASDGFVLCKYSAQAAEEDAERSSEFADVPKINLVVAEVPVHHIQETTVLGVQWVRHIMFEKDRAMVSAILPFHNPGEIAEESVTFGNFDKERHLPIVQPLAHEIEAKYPLTGKIIPLYFGR